jgi:hypothetical protein
MGQPRWVPSRGRIGDSYDAVAESSFASLKRELDGRSRLARGLSTCDVEASLVEARGRQAALSPPAL